MTSLQSQYLLWPSLACNTAWTRLCIDSINWQIRSCGILLHSCSRACCSLSCLQRWLTTAHVSIQVIHKCSIGFKSSDLNGQGSTVTFWLAKKSTVERTVCGRALSCWKTSLRRSITGSMCGVKTPSLCRAALRLLWMCTSWGFRRRIWHSTSSHFLRRKCRPQWRSSMRTSHYGVCRYVYGHLWA